MQSLLSLIVIRTQGPLFYESWLHWTTPHCICLLTSLTILISGRRGSGLTALDQELSDIHGCLFRKKGLHWKQRWCAVSEDTFYAYRDSQYTQEDFRCNLRKCYVVPSFQEPGRASCFRLVRRKGEEIVLAAEDTSEVERWITVLHRQTSKYHLSEGIEITIWLGREQIVLAFYLCDWGSIPAIRTGSCKDKG